MVCKQVRPETRKALSQFGVGNVPEGHVGLLWKWPETPHGLRLATGGKSSRRGELGESIMGNWPLNTRY